MRSQFNTKASSSALWVFPPVVELRRGLEWVTILVPFFFFPAVASDGWWSSRQQFLSFVSWKWKQTWTFLCQTPHPDPPVLIYNSTGPQRGKHGTELLVVTGTRGQCCTPSSLLSCSIVCGQTPLDAQFVLLQLIRFGLMLNSNKIPLQCRVESHYSRAS